MSTPTPGSAGSNKRRRSEISTQNATQNARKKVLREIGGGNFYDPDQDEATKRATTQSYRDLAIEVNDSRAEYLQRDSRGIQEAVHKADRYIKDVKQTSTAAIDSRILVNLGDLSYKKINSLSLGDSTTSIDVDDFLSKCISYMRSAPGADADRPTSTQRRRRRRADDDEDEEETQDEVLGLDWAYLGRTVCFQASRRPCLSSFLLGPLSVQKKARTATQKRATQRVNADPSQMRRPVQLDEEALDKQEQASLTQLCGAIANCLERAQKRGKEKCDAQQVLWEDDDHEPTEEEVIALMRKNHIRSNEGVPLFDFCVNPKSFGQTVENFFYVSFLIKEGRVGLEYDDDDMPTLGCCPERTVAERQETPRNQAVFTLDFDTWQDIIESCNIKASIIPHRDKEIWEDDDGVLKAVAVAAPQTQTERRETIEQTQVTVIGESEDDELYN